MKVVELCNTESTDSEFSLKKLYTESHVEVSHFTLKPSQVIEQQAFPVEVIYYLIQGKAIVESNTIRKVVNAPVLLKPEKGANLGFINAGETQLDVLFIKLKK